MKMKRLACMAENGKEKFCWAGCTKIEKEKKMNEKEQEDVEREAWRRRLSLTFQWDGPPFSTAATRSSSS